MTFNEAAERRERVIETLSMLQDLVNSIDQAHELVQYTAILRMRDMIERLSSVLVNAETAMEQVLGLYLDLYVPDSIVAHDLGFYCEVRQQKRIELDNAVYQVDFLLWAEIPVDKLILQMAVDCLSTDTVAGRDRVRLDAQERAFKAAGIPLVRCTAVEIANNPLSCAIGVVQQFEKLLASHRAQAN